ncbi:MAG: class I SAM-dependent methyltransferase [Lachnospiraceae bacterium]|nr:class I SAM-dependent methyltransferase [Lachnospiraceae bacterium]
MFTRWKRYLQFSIQYFLFERPKGLDFTMRNKSLLKKSDGLYHGYSRTTEKHTKAIFDSLILNGEDKLLDIGCGKGAVLRTAAEYPFQEIAGIDIDANLIDIAVRNFQILGIEDRVSCMRISATKFKEYNKYNIFFMFNPFAGPVMEKVVDELLKVSEKKAITIIYHNPVYLELFRQKGEVTVLKQLYDKTKNYYTCIFTVKPMQKTAS